MSENRHSMYENRTTSKEEQLQELYTKLGKAYYEGGFEDPLPELLPLFDRITMLKAKIEHAQASIGKTRRWCSRCGAELKPDAGFCGKCGQCITE